jgi:hypothetical protein
LDAAYPIYQGQQIAAQNKATASSLLQATDWSTLPDVTTQTPKLDNQADFVTYRNQVRAIAVNPPTTPATFPTVPVAVWS